MRRATRRCLRPCSRGAGSSARTHVSLAVWARVGTTGANSEVILRILVERASRRGCLVAGACAVLPYEDAAEMSTPMDTLDLHI